MSVGDLIQKFLNIFKFHKRKLFFFFGCMIFFLFVLFPYGDIGDLVSAQVAKLTSNQIYIQFEEPGLSLFPNVGIKLKNVSLETTFLPALKAKSLSISPSISGLLTFRPGVSIHASQSLGGDIDLSFKKTKVSGKPGQVISVDADNLDLSEVAKLGSYSLPLKGQFSMSSTAEMDVALIEQPKGEVEITISKFSLPPDTIATPMGPLTLPSLALGSIQLKGELHDGKLLVSQATIGQGADEIRATVKGQMDLRFNNVGGRSQIMPGSYNFEVRLTAQNSLQQKAAFALFLSYLNSFKKSSSASSADYAFRISAPGVSEPPKMTAL